MPWTPVDNLKSNTVLLIFISLQYYGFRNYSIKHFATWLSLDLIKNLLVTINNAKTSWSGSYTVDKCRRLKPTVNVSHRGPRNHGVTIEFSLNVFTEFAEQNISKRARTCHPRYLLWGCYRSTSKTPMRDRIFKLSPIHGSVIYLIPWIRWIQWIPVTFRENSTNFVVKVEHGTTGGQLTFLIKNVLSLPSVWSA